ncbi:MAG: LD-carboxypeptidase [Ignavibacteria bacterium]|nr:LD-carboxypeptidase [Ignavibacteria bacterium]
MHFVQREDVQGIMCARGGWGSLRILRLLDYDIIRNNPKMIIGFSDLTALINAIYTNAGLVTFHGPVASSFNQFIYQSFKRTLLTEAKDKISLSEPKAAVIVKGKAKGRIIGGNLTVLNSLLGTPYEFDSDGAILIIEEKSEDPYKIDRMLTQLKLAGKLDNIAAAIIGDLAKLDRKRNFFPGYSPTLREVFEQHFKELGKPTIISFPFGHTQRNSTIPIGVEAELDATGKTLTFNNFNNA